jgi:hypothetical protein
MNNLFAIHLRFIDNRSINSITVTRRGLFSQNPFRLGKYIFVALQKQIGGKSKYTYRQITVGYMKKISKKD